MFWGDTDLTVVPPAVQPMCHEDDDSDNNNSSPQKVDLGGGSRTNVFNFDHVKEFTIPISEEFLEHCLEGALSIEVYGHRSAGFAATAKWDERRQLAKSLADRSAFFIISIFEPRLL